MVASSNIKTPMMRVPVLSSRGALEKARLLQKKFSRVYLTEVSRPTRTRTHTVLGLTVCVCL